MVAEATALPCVAAAAEVAEVEEAVEAAVVVNAQVRAVREHDTPSLLWY